MRAIELWTPMPHAVEIHCPTCGGCARFEFAEGARVLRRDDQAYFQQSPYFELVEVPNPHGPAWMGAVYHEGLHGPPQSTLTNLPRGYHPLDWAHGPFRLRGHATAQGVAQCQRCGHHGRHLLRWPRDAAFQVRHEERVLWAYHRESAIELRDYLESPESPQRRFAWAAFLLKVPGHFLRPPVRATLVRRFDGLLGSPKLSPAPAPRRRLLQEGGSSS